MLRDHSLTTRFDIEFEPNHAAASQARQAAREHLDSLSLDPAIAADLELVIAELASNAVEQEPDTRVTLTVGHSGAGLVVTVANQTTGAGFEHRPSDHQPDVATGLGAEEVTLAERGWGMGIVHALTDDLWVDNVGGWTSVSCLRRLHPTTG